MSSALPLQNVDSVSTTNCHWLFAANTNNSFLCQPQILSQWMIQNIRQTNWAVVILQWKRSLAGTSFLHLWNSVIFAIVCSLYWSETVLLPTSLPTSRPYVYISLPPTDGRSSLSSSSVSNLRASPPSAAPDPLSPNFSLYYSTPFISLPTFAQPIPVHY